MSILNSCLIGIFPLFVLLLVPNIVDQTVLQQMIESFLSWIPKEPEILHEPPPPSSSSSSSFSEEIKNFQNSNSKQHKTVKIRDEPRVSTHSNDGSPDVKTRNNEDNNDNQRSTTTSTINTKYERTRNIDQQISHIRNEYQKDPTNIHKALNYADALRQRDLMIHDGGSIQQESIKAYKNAIKRIKTQWKLAVSNGSDVRLSSSNTNTRFENIMKETFLPNEQKSIHGLLVTAYCNLGKQYFMANMFEKAVEVYNSALRLEHDYIDAMNSRGSAYVILGKYKEAGDDFSKVLALDKGEMITDVFTGLAKVLVAKEDVVANGWDELVSVLDEKIPVYEKMMERIDSNNSNNPEVVQGRKMISDKLVSNMEHIINRAILYVLHPLSCSKKCPFFLGANRKSCILPCFHIMITRRMTLKRHFIT